MEQQTPQTVTEEPQEVVPQDSASTETENQQYEDDMLQAFIQKSDKVAYYQNALKKMTVTGQVNFRWHWSWWAFIGTWLFLLYRKAYLPALISFAIALIIPFAWILFMIVMGGIAPYFVIKRYTTLKNEIELRYNDSQKRIEAMQEVGGFHTWVVWVAVILNLLIMPIMFIGSLAT